MGSYVGSYALYVYTVSGFGRAALGSGLEILGSLGARS